MPCIAMYMRVGGQANGASDKKPATDSHKDRRT